MIPENVQIQAEEEALQALGRARAVYDAAMSRVADMWRKTWEEQMVLESATAQYKAAKEHFHAISQRSEGL